MKSLLARGGTGHPHLLGNILHAIPPIMTEGPLPEATPGGPGEARKAADREG